MQPKLKLLILLVLFYNSLFSQAFVASLKRCPVKTLNYEQGLQNNSTTSIITDNRGFTWISTYTGMQRYNGYVLETVNPVIGREKININSSVYFFGLKNGLIWMSYKKGILEYNPQTNSFTKIIELTNVGNLSFLIIPVKETNEGIWCLQYKTGLMLYSKNGKLIRQFSDADIFINNAFSFPEVIFNQFCATNNQFIFLYDGQNKIKQFNLHTYQSSLIPVKVVYGLTCNNTHVFYVTNDSITSFNINSKQAEKSFSIKQLVKENFLNGTCFLNEKNQLLLSINNHLFEFDTLCNYKNEITNLNHNTLLALGFIKLIYADNFKRIWLLTNDDIKRIQNFDIPFEHFIYENEKNNFIRSLYYDEDKKILLAGCYNGGIQLYDSLGNALWQVALQEQNIKDINVIEKLQPGNYLIETIARGCYVFNLSSKSFRQVLFADSVRNKFNLFAINFINNTQKINDSTLCIATMQNVYECVFKNDVIQSVKIIFPENFLSSKQFTAVCYAKDKKIYAGTNSGKMLVYDDSKIQTIEIPENYIVRCIKEDAQQNIWAGTDKGLFVFNKNKLVKTITNETGLLNDCIYALTTVDDKAAVFASSNLGLSYVSLNQSPINYTKESGLQENEFNTNSAVKTQQGKYFFGGINGITAFYPSSLFSTNDKPLLNITKLIVDDSTYNYADVYKNNSIRLPYNKNHIELDFAAAGLLNANEYVYQYRLKDFENHWQTTHEPTGIKYVLEPGNYVFEIMYHPVFSSGNNFFKSFNIIISTPWWQTWLFKSVLILSCIIIIALIVFWYNRRKYLQQINALELQQKIQHERQRISRDLHDNLGAYAAAIAANVSMMNQAKDENVQQLKINSQAIITQLNDTIWALNKESVSLTAISDRLKVFLQKIKPNYPNINVDINEEINNDVKLLPVNALHLFRILQETINNAVRHSNCKNIFVQILSNDEWQISIKDDGKGVFISSKTEGNGLKNIKMRAAEAGWKVDWINAIPSGLEVIIYSTIN